METVTISKKALRDFVKKQDAMREEVKALRSIVFEFAKDEIRPGVAKRLMKISKGLDRGEGTRIRSVRGFKAYLRGL